MTLDGLKTATNGKVLSSPFTEFSGVGTDSRQPMDNQIFFALRGERFDAHQFLPSAVERGAKALVVDCKPPGIEELSRKVSVILVEDTLDALQSFAHWWRKKQRARILALTGSSGKTSTKEFAATLIGRKQKVWASSGSFNNHWGVPLTLLGIREDIETAVVEMGMNHAGEIAQLCKIADPDAVMVTMVGRAHIGAFGTEEKIAEAKAEIYSHSRPTAIQIYNLDNPHTRKMWRRATKDTVSTQIITFSTVESADVCLECLAQEVDSIHVAGEICGVMGESRVPVFGRHNVNNLAAAAALALAAGLQPQDIWDGLSQCHLGWGRNQWLQLANGTRVLFDAYNANPESMSALLDNTLRVKVSGRKIAVLGDMLELGMLAPEFHVELGVKAASCGFSMIWFVGRHGASFKKGLEESGYQKKLILSDTYEEKLATELGSMLNPDDVVVVKGSRGVGLERVVEAWSPIDFESKLGKKAKPTAES